MKKIVIVTLLTLTVASTLVGCTTTITNEAKNTKVNITTDVSKNTKDRNAITRGSLNEIKPWEINFQYYPHDELPEEILPKNIKTNI